MSFIASPFAPPLPAPQRCKKLPDADAVLASFNTWAFKREQPSEPDMLRAVIARRVSAAGAIPFVLYWGKGPRNRIAAPDLTCLDYLARMKARVSEAYPPGAAFVLLQTDTHARLNGHDEGAIDSYFEDVAVAANARGMRAWRLSALVAAGADTCDRDVDEGDRVEAGLVTELEQCARRWYRGTGDAAEGAARYLQLNMVERRAVERHLPDSVFVTFNGSRVRSLFPQRLPVFYMYALRKGTSVKPWFTDADGRPFAGAGDFTP